MVTPSVNYTEFHVSPNVSRAEPVDLSSLSECWEKIEPSRPARIFEEECDIARVLELPAIGVHLQAPPVVVLERSPSLCSSFSITSSPCH